MRNRDTERALRSCPVASPGRRVVQEHLLAVVRAAANGANARRPVAIDDAFTDPVDDPDE